LRLRYRITGQAQRRSSQTGIVNVSFADINFSSLATEQIFLATPLRPAGYAGQAEATEFTEFFWFSYNPKWNFCPEMLALLGYYYRHLPVRRYYTKFKRKVQ
jgi:hypothetical protein